MNCLNYCNTIFQRVDDLPSLVDATRNHAYITPDNKIYIINADGTGYMQMSTSGGGVTVGLSSEDGSITIVETKNSVTHTFDLKVSDDIINRITALENRPDKDTIYDDSVLEAKINDILDRVSRTGNTLTAGDGLYQEDNTLNLDLAWLSNYIGTTNEDLLRPVFQNDRIYLDVRPLKTKLQDIMDNQSGDNDNQTLSVNKGVLSISNGNNVDINPYSRGLVYLNNGTDLGIELRGNNGFNTIGFEFNHADLMYYLFGRYSSLVGVNDGLLDLVRDEENNTYKLVVKNQQNTAKYNVTHSFTTTDYSGTTITINTDIPNTCVSDIHLYLSNRNQPLNLYLSPMGVDGETINMDNFQIQINESSGFYSIVLHDPSKSGGATLGVSTATYRQELSDSPFDNVTFAN